MNSTQPTSTTAPAATQPTTSAVLGMTSISTKLQAIDAALAQIQQTITQLQSTAQIAALIGEAISGQLKLTTVINFVKGVIPNIDEDEVSNMISHLVNVIFNNGATITSPITSAVSLPVAAPPSSSLIKRRKSVSFSAFAKKS